MYAMRMPNMFLTIKPQKERKRGVAAAISDAELNRKLCRDANEEIICPGCCVLDMCNYGQEHMRREHCCEHCKGNHHQG